MRFAAKYNVYFLSTSKLHIPFLFLTYNVISSIRKLLCFMFSSHLYLHITRISLYVLQKWTYSCKEMCYHKKQQAAATCFFFFFLYSLSLQCSPSPLPITLIQGIPLCQCARQQVLWKQCTNHRARSMAHAFSPPVVRWDWLLLSAPGFPDNSQDPRTTVRLPAAKSSNDRPPPLKQSQGHTGTERPAKTRALTGTEEQKQMTISVFFQSVLKTICLSVIHNNHPI